MMRRLIKLAVAVAVSAPMLAISANRLVASQESDDARQSWCESQNCPGGDDKCVSYLYPDGGLLQCWKTINDS